MDPPVEIKLASDPLVGIQSGSLALSVSAQLVISHFSSRVDKPFMTKPVLIVAIKRAVVGHLGILLEAGLTRRRSCQAPVGVGRFVIRATHERGVGVPSSRSLATATREAVFSLGGQASTRACGVAL